MPVGVHLHCCSWVLVRQLVTGLQEEGLWNCFGSLLEKYSASCLVPPNKKDQACEEAILRLRFRKISSCEIPPGYWVSKLHQQEFGRMWAKDCLQIQTGVYLEFLFWVYNRVVLLWDPDSRCFANLLLLECLMPVCVCSWWSVCIFSWNGNFLLMIYEQRFCVCVA